jgi:HlyD family secretion protein
MDATKGTRGAKRWAFWATFGLATGLLLLVGWWGTRRSTPFSARFALEPVTRGDVVHEVRAPGRVEAGSATKPRVVASVDDTHLGEVAAQQPATLTSPALPGRVFHGVVTAVQRAERAADGGPAGSALIDVVDSNGALPPGATVSVRIRASIAEDVVRVPVEALRFTPPGMTRGKWPEVWVLTGSGFGRIEVLTGVTDGTQTAIVVGTLEPGRRVVVGLTPEGQRVYGAPPQ